MSLLFEKLLTSTEIDKWRIDEKNREPVLMRDDGAIGICKTGHVLIRQDSASYSANMATATTRGERRKLKRLYRDLLRKLTVAQVCLPGSGED
ncbi:MAG: hypothetical protein AAFR21_19075 [Pseudomonadota bacterium]